MRRILNQAASAAVKAEGTIFAIVYRRLVPPLGHANNGQRRANVVLIVLPLPHDSLCRLSCSGALTLLP